MILCDHCAHETVCVYESTLRNYCREMEPPKGPFILDIHCTKRTVPLFDPKPVVKGSSDEFIISKVWPEK